MAERRKILVIDDEPAITKLLAVRLSEKYDVFEAGSGSDGVLMFKQQEFDLVLTDVRMPGIHGIHLLKTIKNLSNRCQVILMSGYSDIGMVIEGVNAGAFSFVTKPLDMPAVFSRIEDAMAVVRTHDSQSRILRELKDELAMQTAFSQKLAALATMAGGIAHELSQPLSGIGLFNYNLHCLVREGKEITPEQLLEFTTGIREQLDRATGIITHIKEFSAGGNPGEMEVLNLRQAVERAMELFRHQLQAERIEMEIDVPEGLSARLNRNKFEQVIINLVSNARDSLGERTENGGNGGATIRIVGSEAPEGTTLDVADPGSGIPDQVRKTLFEPFMSSKEDRGGSGLGLYICKKLLEEMGAAIELHETSPSGTTFRINLPSAGA